MLIFDMPTFFFFFTGVQPEDAGTWNCRLLNIMDYKVIVQSHDVTISIVGEFER